MSSTRNWYRTWSALERRDPPAARVEKSIPGINLSDRADDWEHNYRCPDVAVFLPGNLAEKFEAHYRGPADFLVEIVSPHDNTREKIPFYSALGVRELLIIDRYPWSLELYRHNGKELVLAGQSSPGGKPDHSPAPSCRSVSSFCRPSCGRGFALRKLAARASGSPQRI